MEGHAFTLGLTLSPKDGALKWGGEGSWSNTKHRCARVLIVFALRSKLTKTAKIQSKLILLNSDIYI